MADPRYHVTLFYVSSGGEHFLGWLQPPPSDHQEKETSILYARPPAGFKKETVYLYALFDLPLSKTGRYLYFPAGAQKNKTLTIVQDKWDYLSSQIAFHEYKVKDRGLGENLVLKPEVLTESEEEADVELQLAYLNGCPYVLSFHALPAGISQRFRRIPGYFSAPASSPQALQSTYSKLLGEYTVENAEELSALVGLNSNEVALPEDKLGTKQLHENVRAHQLDLGQKAYRLGKGQQIEILVAKGDMAKTVAEGQKWTLDWMKQEEKDLNRKLADSRAKALSMKEGDAKEELTDEIEEDVADLKKLKTLIARLASSKPSNLFPSGNPEYQKVLSALALKVDPEAEWLGYKSTEEVNIPYGDKVFDGYAIRYDVIDDTWPRFPEFDVKV